VTPLEQRLRRMIEANGPIPVSLWMAACLEHYYHSRNPLGRGGDFTTAPEISQIFGELIGLWFAELWMRAGSPPAHLIELGPGRGTLMADFWRAVARVPGFHARVGVHLVETSPALSQVQRATVPHATCHDSLATVPDDAPQMIIANEFFDALPIRQFVNTASGWRERMVTLRGDCLAYAAGDGSQDHLIPNTVRASPPGSIWEVSPAGIGVAAEIGRRLERAGGAALIIDYGHNGPVMGDTLQAVRGHAFADPLTDAGEADLTAHVDFSALAVAAGVRSHGPISHAALLTGLGLHERTEALARGATAEQARLLRTGTERLIAPDAMGSLFKALALSGGGWPTPPVFP
jgi:NADH dehydrogenase [ubiquinone] 1 alpha subcomplex assembly factor 7